MDLSVPRYLAFDGPRRLAEGTLAEVALAVKAQVDAQPQASLWVFNASSSELIDLDCRGTPEQVLQRLQAPALDADLSEGAPAARSGPGRPRLGVVAREVTLLPRHWAWLGAQPGGASVALRKLVEQARRTHALVDARRQSQESAYRFMSAMAGHLAGFEEAARALFAGDQPRFDALVAPWPEDVRQHLQRLAAPAFVVAAAEVARD
jgi:hypothetical protein